MAGLRENSWKRIEACEGLRCAWARGGGVGGEKAKLLPCVHNCIVHFLYPYCVLGRGAPGNTGQRPREPSV